MSKKDLPSLICPHCKEKIMVEHGGRFNPPKTNDIYTLVLTTKGEHPTIRISACNHCKEILGTSKY